MVMNITIDDTAGVLSYSSGWRIQPSGDPSFFQDTYHAAESADQTVSVTFNGTAVYIYGSKGKTYGDFKVQVDDLVTFHTSSLPASSNPAVQYQQVIYGGIFDSGTHLVQLSTTTDQWIDIDYMVLTSVGPDEANPSPGSFSSTVSALNPSTTNSLISSSTLPASSASTSSVSPSGSPLSSHSSPSTSNNSTVTTALTGVFGGLLGLVLLSLLIYHLLKRHRRRQYERERQFRRGPKPYMSSPTTGSSGNASPLAADRRGGVFAGLMGGGGRNSGAERGERSGTPYSGVSGASMSMNAFGGNNNHIHNGSGLRPSYGNGVQPYGSAGAYGFTHAGNGAPDPRQSIDFLSVRS